MWQVKCKRHTPAINLNRSLCSRPYILWQNILDTQEHFSYTADNKKEVLINKGPLETMKIPRR